jgi:hypothetical protein
MITGGDDCLFNSVGSISHVQLTLFGYSLGNDGLIRLRPFDDVILRFEHTSTIVESKNIKFLFLFFFEIFFSYC